MKRYNFISLPFFALVLSSIITFIWVLKLPNTVPVHFGISGEPDRYGSKWIYILFPVIGFLTYFMVPLLAKIDPYSEKIQPKMFALLFIRDVLVLFMSTLSLISVYAAQRGYINTPLITVVLGLLMIVLGNYMPKLPHNWFVGIKTPWTLSDERVWRKTHRVFGLIMMVWGILIILSAFVFPFLLMYIIIAGVLVIVFGAFIYSYVEFAKLKR